MDSFLPAMQFWYNSTKSQYFFENADFASNILPNIMKQIYRWIPLLTQRSAFANMQGNASYFDTVKLVIHIGMVSEQIVFNVHTKSRTRSNISNFSWVASATSYYLLMSIFFIILGDWKSF